MSRRRVNVGVQLQLFFDDHLIERMENLRLKLHSPELRETCIRADRPYETPLLYDPVVIKDEDRYRMWYRTNCEEPYVTGYAESPDGIQWTKPPLGVIEFDASTDNNLVWSAAEDEAHVLCVFRDGNPSVPDDARYKAIGIGAGARSLRGLVSPDGIHWENVKSEPLIVGPDGDDMFDSHNIAFWDAAHGQYVAYLRGWRNGVRLIRRSTSTDFLNWSELAYLDLGGAPVEHLYKNAATPYYRRPDIYLMFPKRFIEERTFDADHPHPGLSDIVFMHSRDGLRWDRRFMEAFVRPGLDTRNWHERAIEIGPGLVPTGDDEMSLYMVANYRTPCVHVRRLALRVDGFVSVHAGYAGGEFATHPLIFDGSEFVMNYATSAAGSIRIEIQDAEARPVPGFTLGDAPDIYGDEIERVASWKDGCDVSALAGRPVRLRFVLKDADLYSIRFRSGQDTPATVVPRQDS